MADQEQKRKRASRAKVPTGPIHPREITQLRDKVGNIREAARVAGQPELEKALESAWVDLDRMDARFRIHHEKADK